MQTINFFPSFIVGAVWAFYLFSRTGSMFLFVLVYLHLFGHFFADVINVIIVIKYFGEEKLLLF